MPDPVLDPDRDFSELRSDHHPTPPRSTGGAAGWVAGVLVVALVGAGYAWWQWQAKNNAVAEPPVAAAPPEAAASAPVAAASEPTGPQNLIDPLAPADAAQLPELAESDAAVAQALTELLGQPSVGSFLQLDGFVRRVVATVDNLPRAQAPSRMWPVQLAPRRFSVEGVPGTHGQLAIADGNAGRYSAFVAFAEAIPIDQAVAVYARLYPLFQQAYEELGYPGKYFNDRLVAVLDHLLQTPEPTGPLLVQLTEVKGEVPSTRTLGALRVRRPRAAGPVEWAEDAGAHGSRERAPPEGPPGRAAQARGHGCGAQARGQGAGQTDNGGQEGAVELIRLSAG